MKFWAAIASLLAGLGSLIALVFGAKRSGVNKERAKQAERAREQAEKVDEIREKQLDAAADRPRDRDELRDRMRSGRF